MNKNLILAASLLSSMGYAQNSLFQVGPQTKFSVDQNALVYNGGSLQTVGEGIYEIKGNVMVVGVPADGLKTTATAGPKLDGGNFILKLNNLTDYSSYGQLYISGLSQDNLTGIVDKEFRAENHGTGNYFQQIALPFYDKTLNTLSTEFGKTFNTTRFTQNEILKFDNTNAISRHYTDLTLKATDPTGYYMLGSRENNLNVAATTHILRGRPYADINNLEVTLKNAGIGVQYGTGGSNTNQYRERYNSYLQDAFDFSSGAWVDNYAKNIYQFGNPFFTNLDLSKIGYSESTKGDGNQLRSIQGIRYDPGEVKTLPGGSTFSTGAKNVTFNQTTGVPAGDVGLIVKPMQTFVVKLRETANAETDPTKNTLKFQTLRRFKNSVRANATAYDVTANKMVSNRGTLKQLGIKGLDSEGNEIARSYYIVYPEAISGHSTQPTMQATNSSKNIMGTFEEDKLNGGYDSNFTGKYWLYINEANEYDYAGKAIPFNLYSNEIKSLRFEILEDATAIEDGAHRLSTGIGFYYKSEDGIISEISQNQIIPVTSAQYSLYYGKSSALGTGSGVKPSRTMVVYNPSEDDYVVRFDSNWQRADIKVFDMSGRLIHSGEKVKTTTDYRLNLGKNKAAYVVTAVSSQGEKVSTKILR